MSLGLEIDLLEIGWGGVDWIGLAQGRDKWRALVNEPVGASHGILPHVGNTGDRVTLTQIGIQVTAPTNLRVP
jgi:hypothetical protein